MKRILKYTKVIYKDKSYIGNEIELNKELLSKFCANLISYPASFIEKVEKENGLIQITFEKGGIISKALVNVSTELLDEFHLVYV